MFPKGVEVSWVHNPRKSLKDLHNGQPPARSASAHVPAARARPQPRAQESAVPPSQPTAQTTHDSRNRSASVGHPTISVSSEPATPPSANSKPSSRRPSMLRGSSTDKSNADGKPSSKRSPSWIANISNKFSLPSPGIDRSTPVSTVQRSPQPSPMVNGGGFADTQKLKPSTEASEEAEPYVPPKPTSTSTSFFSSLTRKLSSGSQTGGIPKVQGKGGLCERRILNVDPNRQRCLVPELELAKLRKVSFCVDVEIAGGPRYTEEDEPEEDDDARNKRKTEAKLRERAEGEALKRPNAMAEDKNEDGQTQMENHSTTGANEMSKGVRFVSAQDQDDGASLTDGSTNETGVSDKKKERKKRSEEERKERKEKRRRRAEENGSVPVELSLEGDGRGKTESLGTSPNVPNRKPPPTAPQGTVTANDVPDPKRDRPTTDPVRIYRRCCQLRETPILKRITEQLMSPMCCVPAEPGVVHCLDLTGSRLQLADVVTLGDWLAVVPVKKLLLEDADINDEGLRCILAGLLSAKRPEPTKRKSTFPRHRERVKITPYQERTGTVEKLVLKNNPRLTRNGWKHISLFLYMCRSIKAIDLSMIRFPDTLPPSNSNTPVKSPQGTPKGSGQDTDAAETIYKCLSERLGGSKLEELILSECALTAPQIRMMVDGAVVCGVSRLGLAGNHIDDAGLEHVLRYVRSGMCGGLDLGSNDLRGKLGGIADALDASSKTPFWALSLADCNLDSESIKPLFAALRRLPDFRFIDLSHNQDLCGKDHATISLLRRYIGQLKSLKRVHLSDVGMNSKQAIALADVLPEGPKLAHLSLMKNPQLTALANAKSEADQEEACALYASLMAAVKVSSTLICIDIDVPSVDNSEIVKALAKQTVAYSLRNMEHFMAEVTPGSTANAASALTQPYGGEKQLKEIDVPDILMHLVGHVDGVPDNHDAAPGDDYIVGGTGVVKALQYVLGEKADDLRRNSVPGTPTRGRPSSSAGFDAAQRGKAKKMSKNLLESARKIRSRLQPALVKEATSGDEMAYRRMLYLDQTLQSMIQRFEEEYPDCRLGVTSPLQPARATRSPLTEQSAPLSLHTSAAELIKGTHFDNDDEEEDFDDDGAFRPALSRHNSDVSTASRALSMEEGHLHRLGHRLRRQVVESPSVAPAGQGTFSLDAEEEKRRRDVQERLESITGTELKSLVEHSGWDAALQKVGANMNDLRVLQEQDPKAWEEFQESQAKARLNATQGGQYP